MQSVMPADTHMLAVPAARYAQLAAFLRRVAGLQMSVWHGAHVLKDTDKSQSELRHLTVHVRRVLLVPWVRGQTPTMARHARQLPCAGTTNGSPKYRRQCLIAAAQRTAPNVLRTNTPFRAQLQRVIEYATLCRNVIRAWNTKPHPQLNHQTEYAIPAQPALRATVVRRKRSAKLEAPLPLVPARARSARQGERQPQAAQRALPARQDNSARDPVRSARRAQPATLLLARGANRALRGDCAPQGMAWRMKAHRRTTADARHA